MLLHHKISLPPVQIDVQEYGTVVQRPLSLDQKVRLASVDGLRNLLMEMCTFRQPASWEHRFGRWVARNQTGANVPQPMKVDL
jgi:hypothetical protein